MATRGEWILAQYNTAQLRERLQQLPTELATAKGELRTAREAAQAAQQRRAEIEAELAMQIATAIGDNGKPAYSNAETRAAALITARRDSGDYRAWDISVRLRESDVAVAQDEVARLQDEFQALRYVARLVTAELAVLADDDAETEDRPAGERTPEQAA